jgi:hypothetical protein
MRDFRVQPSREATRLFSATEYRGENFMSAKIMLSILMACAAPAMVVHAAEDPAKAERKAVKAEKKAQKQEKKALNKQCESSNGQVEDECKKVATKMVKDPPPKERSDMTGQDIRHSSPVMDQDAARDAKQSARENATEKAKPAPRQPPQQDPR